MQRNELETQNVQQTDESIFDNLDDQDTQIESKTISMNKQDKDSSLIHIKEPNSQKYSQQAKNQIPLKQNIAETSLAHIIIQSPVKRQTIRSDTKINEKPKITPAKAIEKVDNYSKEKIQEEPLSIGKLYSDSYIKSSLKSYQKIKKINKPFYEQTFYITGMKQNYLLLLSDTNQVLEFPIGMFTTQAEIPESQNHSEEGSITNDNFHLIKDIKIGQPIKIKLQLDFLRQQKDEKIFNSLQKTLNEEYSNPKEDLNNLKNKEISLRKNK